MLTTMTTNSAVKEGGVLLSAARLSLRGGMPTATAAPSSCKKLREKRRRRKEL